MCPEQVTLVLGKQHFLLVQHNLHLSTSTERLSTDTTLDLSTSTGGLSTDTTLDLSTSTGGLSTDTAR